MILKEIEHKCNKKPLWYHFGKLADFDGIQLYANNKINGFIEINNCPWCGEKLV